MITNFTGTGDYIKPELHHQPDIIILHCRTNDIPNEINTLKKLKKLLKEIEGYNTQKKSQVVISSLIKRYDQDFNEDIKSINESLINSKFIHIQWCVFY